MRSYSELPYELFFETDYHPLVTDGDGYVIDEHTGLAPHLTNSGLYTNRDNEPHDNFIYQATSRNKRFWQFWKIRYTNWQFYRNKYSKPSWNLGIYSRFQNSTNFGDCILSRTLIRVKNIFLQNFTTSWLIYYQVNAYLLRKS